MNGKYYAGTVPGGEGKEDLKVEHQPEFSGVHRSGPNPKLKVEGGHTAPHEGREESTFNPLAPGYAGPQRLGEMNALGKEKLVNPDDVHHS